MNLERYDNIKHRRGTPRSGWKQGPKSTRRLFLNELKRSNNPLSACAKAGVLYTWYEEAVSTGFISQEQLAEALAIYRAKHPQQDMLPTKQTSQELEDLGIAASGVVADDFYDDGWIDVGYEDDEW